MDNQRLHQLKRLAEAFHAALAKPVFAETGLNLANFPFECCHHACKLLRIFLHENGFTESQIMAGNRPDDPSPSGRHLWLSVEGVDVDITAYQFGDVDEKVIVSPQSVWHLNRKGRPSRFQLDGESIEDWAERIRQLYNSRDDSLYDRLANDARQFLP